MRKRKYIINLFAVAALLVGCGESLEDTYSDYAGDGKIRYVAKCTEVHATPGWERLLVEWINGTDATVDKIKVKWSCEDLKDSILLPSTTESYELKNLTNGTYRFDVSAIDFAGNESLVETTYGRPYTREHEIMLAFTRGVVKPYFLKNKLFSSPINGTRILMRLNCNTRIHREIFNIIRLIKKPVIVLLSRSMSEREPDGHDLCASERKGGRLSGFD